MVHSCFHFIVDLREKDKDVGYEQEQQNFSHNKCSSGSTTPGHIIVKGLTISYFSSPIFSNYNMNYIYIFSCSIRLAFIYPLHKYLLSLSHILVTVPSIEDTEVNRRTTFLLSGSLHSIVYKQTVSKHVSYL